MVLVVLMLVSLVCGLMAPGLGWVKWLAALALVASGVTNIVLAVFNVQSALLLFQVGDAFHLRRQMRTLKMGSIPYFVLNFILYVLLALLIIAASRGLVIFTPIPLMFIIPVLFTYLSLLFTSPYGIAYAATVHREGKMSAVGLAFHILLQLCFVLDVVDTAVLLMKHKIRPSDSRESTGERSLAPEMEIAAAAGSDAELLADPS